MLGWAHSPLHTCWVRDQHEWAQTSHKRHSNRMIVCLKGHGVPPAKHDMITNLSTGMFSYPPCVPWTSLHLCVKYMMSSYMWANNSPHPVLAHPTWKSDKCEWHYPKKATWEYAISITQCQPRRDQWGQPCSTDLPNWWSNEDIHKSSLCTY